MSGSDQPASNVTNPAWLDSVLLSLPSAREYCFALSGGLDSVSLLSFLTPFLRARGAALRAIHVHHGLSPNADAWADFCRDLCRQLSVSYQFHKVSIKPEGNGLEAAARQARYQIFEHELRPGEVLLQGHHQDDQAETVLLRLMRGATPAELAAIPQSRSLGQGSLFRPWLGVARQTLLTAAVQTGLRWIEDESNQDLALDRNYLRHAVLPVLAERWPQARAALARVALQARQQAQLLDQLLAPSLATALRMTPFGPVLRLDTLRSLLDLQRNALIRRWLESLSVPQIPAAILQRLEREVLAARADASPELRWGQHTLRVYRGDLFYVTAAETSNQSHLFARTDLPLRLELNDWRVELAESEVCPDIDAAALTAVLAVLPDEGAFELRGKRQKDALRLSSGQHQAMQRVCQDLGIPPWWRASWPMLFAGNVLICAGPGKVDPACRHDFGYEMDGAKSAKKGDKKGDEKVDGKRHAGRHLIVRWSRKSMPQSLVKF